MRKLLRNLGFCLLASLSVLTENQAFALVKRGHVQVGEARIHYGVFDSQGEAQGDVLYIHGFGDRFDNHQPLFESFTEAGLRVIAFDLPSHGDSSGEGAGDLNQQTFDSLVAIAARVFALNSASEGERPLVLAGWSLGGLIATRIAQDSVYQKKFPPIAGLILYAPSVAPKPCVGSLICAVVNSTLTHDALLFDREIKPKFPLSYLAFDARVLWAAAKAWRSPLPADLSTLVVVADRGDRYVFTDKIVDWIKLQRAAFIARVPAYACSGARHELDNETAEFGGAAIRDLSARFAKVMASGALWDPKSHSIEAPCVSL